MISTYVTHTLITTGTDWNRNAYDGRVLTKLITLHYVRNVRKGYKMPSEGV
jgi:hypothetical protein